MPPRDNNFVCQSYCVKNNNLQQVNEDENNKKNRQQ